MAAGAARILAVDQGLCQFEWTERRFAFCPVNVVGSTSISSGAYNPQMASCHLKRRSPITALVEQTTFIFLPGFGAL